MKLTIQYTLPSVIAFAIEQDIYYLRHGPAFNSELYNAALTKLIVANLNNWLLAKTGHRHGQQSLLDMGRAFDAALNATFHGPRALALAADIIVATLKYVFTSAYGSKYKTLYDVELLEIDELQRLMDGLRHRATTLAPQHLTNLLRRLLHLSRHAYPQYIQVIENMMAHLQIADGEIKYPDTRQYDEQVVARILERYVPLVTVPSTATQATVEAAHALQQLSSP